jgi:hypothetical protein
MVEMLQFSGEGGPSDGGHHVWYDASVGCRDALDWLQNKSDAPWTAMFYELHEPDILCVIGSAADVYPTSRSWTMNRLYVRFSSKRDAATFRLRFRAVAVTPQLPHQYVSGFR